MFMNLDFTKQLAKHDCWSINKPMTILKIIRSMASINIFSWFLFFIILQCNASIDKSSIGKQREALEIIIGGGGGYAPPPGNEECPPPPPPEPLCPPPPPPPSPPPPPPPVSPFPSKNIERDFKTIQNFKSRITYDPNSYVKTWKGPNVCNYKGFKCSTVPDMKVRAVAGVNFNQYNFSGPGLNLAGFIEELRDVSVFHVNSNNFAGSIPTTIGERVRYLYELDLSNNKYSGLFPAALLSAKNLTYLDIRFNSFSGSIPPEVFNMDLDVIFVNNNGFSGNLPSNLGSTPVSFLSLANNQLTGSIPGCIGRAKNLEEVLLLKNSFLGCLPYEIGYLSKLKVFDASFNQLTGPIPHSFGCLKKLEILNLAENEFYGMVPEMLCKLSNLQSLSLSKNYFTQVGPECRKLIIRKKLDVSMNCIIDLPGQRPKMDCAAFFSKQPKCPDVKSLTYVPCKKIGFSSPTEAPNHH